MLVFIDDLLGADELAALNRQLAGLPFADGSVSAGPGARSVKKNLQLSLDQEPRVRPLVEAIIKAVDRHASFFAATLPHRFSAPMFNRYEAGMGYGDHVDNALIGSDRVRTDIAVTLFLSRPEDYDGGELVVEEASGIQRIKLPAGSAVVYPASSVHRVEPVRRGARQAAIFWVQSMVRDAVRRRILFDLDVAINRLKERTGDGPEITALIACYHNLLRQWVEV